MPILALYDYVPPGAAKGACYLCMTAPPQTQYALTTTEIVGEGDLVICVPCLRDAADTIGFVEGERLTTAQEAIDRLEATIKNIETREAGVAQDFADLKRVLGLEASPTEAGPLVATVAGDAAAAAEAKAKSKAKEEKKAEKKAKAKKAQPTEGKEPNPAEDKDNDATAAFDVSAAFDADFGADKLAPVSESDDASFDIGTGGAYNASDSGDEQPS